MRVPLDVNLFCGDSLEVLKSLSDNSIDSIVADPPYGLAFMGKKWDYDVPSVDLWKEVLRVLKPGGHLLSFGGTRTYHRMAVNIEDAGFEIRDQIQWLYGSGFPKSLNISKAIDKAAGVEREVVGKEVYRKQSSNHSIHSINLGKDENGKCNREWDITAPATDLAKQWDGWGTALKPSNEPICMARKPLSEKTVSENVLKWGTGGINVDGCRIGTESTRRPTGNHQMGKDSGWNEHNLKNIVGGSDCGRWPANTLFDEEAAEMLDDQSGHLVGAGNKKIGDNFEAVGSMFGIGTNNGPTSLYDRGGGASRFFYCAKASKSERNAGLEGILSVKQGNRPNSKDLTGKFPDHDHRQCGANNHPTVKPIKLMEYLIKLITPPNGTVLDPFMGSGSTGVAAKNLGFKFIGIEKEQEYFEIAKKRVHN